MAKLKEVCDYFNRSERTIQDWVQKGMPRVSFGEYNLLECAKWYIQDREEKIKELEKGDATLYKLKQENLRLSNEEKEIRLGELKKQYIDVELVKSGWLGVLSIVNLYLESLATTLANKVSLSKSAADIREIVRAEVLKIKTEISNTTPDQFLREMEEEESSNEQAVSE